MTAAATPFVPTTKALSALDLAFFVLESKTRMSNVGPLAILTVPRGAGGARRFADRLMREMKQCPVGAPFNLRYRPPGRQGLPCLETVDEVDLDAHCQRLTLEGPASDEQLFEAVCRLHEQRLDRKRPPWAFYIIDGLTGGRIALYAKVHHGIIDGRGFVEVCTRWFTADAQDLSVRAIWEGLPKRRGPAAGAPRRGVEAQALVQSAARAAFQTARTTLSLYAALARQTLASARLTVGLPLPFLGTPGTLRARPSVRRSFAWCVLPLAEMKAFGKAHEASVNDVLLTVLDMALTRYLADKGRPETSAPLVADMPVALGAAGGAGGNSIAILQFPLGTAGATPLGRLAQIRQRTAAVKQYVGKTNASALVTYTAAVHGIPALLEALQVPRAPMLANMVISNPFGLPERRYLAGAELEMALPVSVLAPGQSLNITAATYDQGLQIAFLGLAAELPDIQRLADLTVQALAQLTLPETLGPARQTRKARVPSRVKETSK